MVKSKGQEDERVNTHRGPSQARAKSFHRRRYFRIRVDREQSEPRPILRKCNSPLEKVLDAACFPLVPYVNRIRGGSFTFRGRTVRLEPNMAGDPSPLHGQGWLNPWDRRAPGRNERGPDLPPRGGRMALVVRGAAGIRARRARPLGSPRPAATRATSRCPAASATTPISHADPRPGSIPASTCAWTVDEKVLPVEKVPAEGRYDLRDRLVCGQGLDNGFGGWGGRGADERPGLAIRAAPVLARSEVLPALFAARRRDLRRRAGDPRQCARSTTRKRMAGARHARARRRAKR